MPVFEDSLRALLGHIVDISVDFMESIPIPPDTPPIAPPQRLTLELVHAIGRNAGLSMDHFVGKIHTWEAKNFLTFKERTNHKGKSIYTINLGTLRPTQTSPIQQQLSAELEVALSRVTM